MEALRYGGSMSITPQPWHPEPKPSPSRGFWESGLALSLILHLLFVIVLCIFAQRHAPRPVQTPASITFTLETADQKPPMTQPHPSSTLQKNKNTFPRQQEDPQLSRTFIQTTRPQADQQPEKRLKTNNPHPSMQKPTSANSPTDLRQPAHYSPSITVAIPVSAPDPVQWAPRRNQQQVPADLNANAGSSYKKRPETSADLSNAAFSSATKPPFQSAHKADFEVEHSPASGKASSGNASQLSRWKVKLLRRLERYKQYPRMAREKQLQGVAYLRFAIDREGHLLFTHLEKSSGVAILDEETLLLARRAEPLPAPPTEIPNRRIELVVPVQFFLK